MKKVIFHPLAEQEFIDAVVYYEQQRPGLGLEYLGEIEHAVNFLIRYPEAGSKIRGSLHRLILPKFSQQRTTRWVAIQTKLLSDEWGVGSGEFSTPYPL